MTRSVTLFAFFILISGLGNIAEASIVFEFGSSSTTLGSAFDGSATNSGTVSGVEITMSASTSTFNATTSGFGINQAASGDDTDAFDFTESGGPGVAEGFTFRFDQDVELTSFSVSSFGSDEISISVGATPVATITTSGTTSLGNFALAANTDVTVITTAGTYGNGWVFESVEVTAVPEPSSFALLALATGVVVQRRRRKNKTNGAAAA